MSRDMRAQSTSRGKISVPDGETRRTGANNSSRSSSTVPYSPPPIVLPTASQDFHFRFVSKICRRDPCIFPTDASDHLKRTPEHKRSRPSSPRDASQVNVQDSESECLLRAQYTSPQLKLSNFQLRMIWLAFEVSRKQALSAGSVPVLANPLQRDKHRINFRQSTWIGEVQHPALLTFVIVQQDSQVPHSLLVAVPPSISLCSRFP
jgi:hypothetical protein